MIRDYCYVGDVVAANQRVLEKAVSGCINIGSGKETRTLKLYQTLLAAAKRAASDIPESLAVLKREGARPGDIPRSCLVTEKARRLLGWSAEIDVASGVRKTLAWRLGKEDHR